MLGEEAIEMIVKIGNNPDVMKLVEPNIIQPFELEKWMVIRVLKVLELFDKELNNG